jgi:hypothetical protein
MTTKNDNYKARTEKEGLGLGSELSVGVPDNGMQNASGDYPKREYNFGSSVNKATVGTKVNKLYTGGGEIGVPLNIPEQMPSQYPFNQVDETPSGHVIEMDDTPGGERVLIKHRKGSGVELRADGTVVISALNNKVEVTGGDQTVIIEGHGNLVYNGNLNLKVSGDYNVEVGGNYNVDVAGYSQKTIGGFYSKAVTGNVAQKYMGTKTEKILGNSLTLRLGDDDYVVKGTRNDVTDGNHEISSGENLLISGEKTAEMISRKTSITGSDRINVQGSEGIIGGAFVRFTGQTYSGALKKRVYGGGDNYVTGGTPSVDSDGSGNISISGIDSGSSGVLSSSDSDGAGNLATTYASGDDFASSSDYETAIFHGSLHGVAKKAQMADNANKSIMATVSMNAVSLNPLFAIGGLKALPKSSLLSNFNLEAEDVLHTTVEPDNIAKVALGKIPQNNETSAHLKIQPIQAVSIDPDDYVRDLSYGKEHYNQTFLKTPRTAEIRSAFRNKETREDGILGATLVAEGLLNRNYNSKVPSAKLSGRVVGKEASSKYGYTPIGNSIENRGKRFRK